MEKNTYSYVSGVSLFPTFERWWDFVQELLQKKQDFNPSVPQLENRYISQQENLTLTYIVVYYSSRNPPHPKPGTSWGR